MAFVAYTIKRGPQEPMPEGICSIHMPSAEWQPPHITISAHDAVKHLTGIDWVNLLFCAETKTVGIRKSPVPDGASKVCRKLRRSSSVSLGAPRAMHMAMRKAKITSGRYALTYDAALNLIVIKLGSRVKEEGSAELLREMEAGK